MEYSVRSAQMAVFKLLNLNKEPIPFPRVSNDLNVVVNAFKVLTQGSWKENQTMRNYDRVNTHDLVFLTSEIPV